MKILLKFVWFFIIVFLLFNDCLYAQSPFTIPPKWFFGRQAGINFTSGSPVVLTGGKVDGTAQEASSTMCDTAGNVLFYTDSYRLYDGNNNFVQFLNGGTSSTNSSVCFPDPANPKSQFYLVTANEDVGGGGEHLATSPGTAGIYYYKIQVTGPGTISVSAPTQLATNTQVSEALCSGSDNNGGYWVVAHQGGGGNGNQIWSWNITQTGVGAKQISSIAGTDNSTIYQSSLKINQCQNRLAAIFWTGKVEVYDWNPTTGMVTGLFRSYTIPGAAGYGCEFSPNGNILYFTSLSGNQLYQFDLIGNSVIPLTGGTSSNAIGEMGTLQLGPDDKIYVTNVSHTGTPAYIGVVNSPNNAGDAACSYNRQGFLLSTTVKPNIYRGIANESFINPTLGLDTITSAVSACAKATLSYKFLRYYGRAAVGIVPNSEQWNFGEGAGFISGLGSNPIHTFANGGTYTVTLKVTDATCNSVWTMSKQVTVRNCTNTPPTCTYNLEATITPVTNIVIDDVNPVTVNFNGNSSVFSSTGTEPHKYYWMTGSADTSTAFSKNPTASLSFAFNGAGGKLPQGTYKIYLVINQGLCLDTDIVVNFTVTHDACKGIEATIVAVNEVIVDQDNFVTVDFSGLTSVFPGSLNAKQYYWIIGSPDTSAAFSKNSASALTFSYKGRGGHHSNGSYDIYLVVKDGNCLDTIISHLDVDYFFIPNLITPNGDSFNDHFEITNIGNRFDLEVYNRWGERIFLEKGYTNNWDLTKVHDGMYYYLLTDGRSDKKYKGWVHVIHASL